MTADERPPPEPPPASGERRAPALVLSCVLGAAGAAALVAGLATGVEGLYVGAAGAGALSLGAALYWRSQLVDEWNRRQRGA